MKLLLQIILLILIVIISVIFYNKYFKKVEIVEIKTSEIKKDEIESDLQNENNIIKNLNYNVDLIEDGNYEIESELSEVIIKDGSEIVLMKKVVAIFTDKNQKKLFIYSDYAEFNSSNYNTLFRENLKIEYENHTITADNLDFNFAENNILVYENVIYNSSNGKIETDNIKLNLISKKVEIFMNDNKKNIKVVSF